MWSVPPGLRAGPAGGFWFWRMSCPQVGPAGSSCRKLMVLAVDPVVQEEDLLVMHMVLGDLLQVVVNREEFWL